METLKGRGGRISAIGPEPTNGGRDAVLSQAPYTVEVVIEGTADMLFHRWNCEAVAGKAAAAKGSKEKKTDNVESYVYRDSKGYICLPGEYLRQSIIHAAKYRQDPRSPRKSAMDLYKAGIICITELCSLGTKQWDYEHMCRVQVQRNGLTRVRPAFKAGWTATFRFEIATPEYIRPTDLQEMITNAGRLIGIGDYRPSYGRFVVKKFEVI